MADVAPRPPAGVAVLGQEIAAAVVKYRERFEAKQQIAKALDSTDLDPLGIDALRRKPGEHITWLDLGLIGRDDPVRAAALWERTLDEARDELDLERLARHLIDHGQGRNAYVALGTFPKGGTDRRAEHALRLAVLWVDLDVGENKGFVTKEAWRDQLAARGQRARRLRRQRLHHRRARAAAFGRRRLCEAPVRGRARLAARGRSGRPGDIQHCSDSVAIG